jgi:hypothetical protein
MSVSAAVLVCNVFVLTAIMFRALQQYVQAPVQHTDARLENNSIVMLQSVAKHICYMFRLTAVIKSIYIRYKQLL